MTSSICSVLIYVPDVKAALDWYALAFKPAERRQIEELSFEYLDVSGVRLEIVPAYAKVTSGAAGSVVYWSVDDFDEGKERFMRAGASLYRGPMQVEDHKQMCMLRDPWGNCFGLHG
ncbi:VOC domain-containing protein (plasmid) [Pararobbsia alpina]|uniref:VOC family protein n=1 Tax=Pararobbsia alpina TaxID=621374 RepID=UPI0039A64598